MTAVAPAPTPVRDAGGRATRAALVLGAMVLLVAAYGLLSLVNDPRGTLGTDTGGKLATLHVMEQRGTLDPDVGYWAARYDPTGALHPLFYTSRVGDRWVNVTTLPMVIAAHPLYDLGGPRAVLLLPMLGAAFTALAARALARRIGGGSGWFAFWTVGLASPIAIYALDFWEHAPGVALALWGIVFLYDVVDERAGWRGALASGLLFGAAATMRTDVLVYAAVAALVAAVVLARHTLTRGTPSWSANVGAGAAWAVGVGIPLFANQLLERAVAGGSIRAGRAAGTASAAGVDGSLRAKEALTTTLGLNWLAPHPDWFFGGVVVALVAYGAWRLTAADRSGPTSGAVALAAAALLYALRLDAGLGFVPGVLTASPLAVAGLVIGWSARRWRMPGAIALLALPVVWVFQYSGGANPQWGGRYVLITGTLLVVGAAVVLSATPGGARWALAALALLVTASGWMWLSQRSHSVADAMRTLPSGTDTVVVSREAHVLREGGAFYTPQRHWLTATDGAELHAAARVAEEAGAARLAVVAVAGRPEPRTLGAYARGARRQVEFLPGLALDVVTYRNRAPAG